MYEIDAVIDRSKRERQVLTRLDYVLMLDKLSVSHEDGLKLVEDRVK